MKYIFLDANKTSPVIISSNVIFKQECDLLKVLKNHKGAIGWTFDDIKGIPSKVCEHRIFLEEGFKPSREAQRRLNPHMLEELKKEILKWLNAGIIYVISDSS